MRVNNNQLHSLDRTLLFQSSDSADPRLGQMVEVIDQPLTKIRDNFPYLIGYPDDEGIYLNGGRPGAKDGPDSIRRFLYRLTPPPKYNSKNHLIMADRGNLNIVSLSLEERHDCVRNFVKEILCNNGRCLSFGGGHDYGYPDAAAFIESSLKSFPSVRPLVINFDAHLDVRPLNKGLTSGTPFFRLLEKYQGQFDFVEIGPQYHCNSQTHLQWCQAQGGKVLFFEEIQNSGKPALGAVSEFLSHELTSRRPTFLSVDIDCFSSSYAMGCSQSWPTGLTPEDFFPILTFLLKKCDVRNLGIYEVNPLLDLDHRTAKLAALIAYRFIFSSASSERDT